MFKGLYVGEDLLKLPDQELSKLVSEEVFRVDWVAEGCPPYSSSISHVWRVVKYMKVAGYICGFTLAFNEPSVVSFFWLRVDPRSDPQSSDPQSPDPSDFDSCTVIDNAIERAICVGAILALTARRNPKNPGRDLFEF